MAIGSSLIVRTGVSSAARLEMLSPKAQSSPCSSPPSVNIPYVASTATFVPGESHRARATSASALASTFASEITGSKVRLDCCGSPSPRALRNCTHARAQAATCGQQTQEKARSPSMQSRTSVEEATLYDLLGVDHSASLKEVKTAYRQLARRLHPDVVPPQFKEESTRNFLKVHSAYMTLCDPERKAAYDLQLSMQRQQAKGYGSYRRSAPISTSWDYQSASSYYSAPSSFSSEWKGRSWETDQCW